MMDPWSDRFWAVSESVRYLYDGMRVILERNASNTSTASSTRGADLSGSIEGAGRERVGSAYRWLQLGD